MLNQGKTEQDFEVVVSPVKAYLTKSECQTFLNKLCTVQAFYNNININNLANMSKDPKTQLAVILNANDRKIVGKQFQKHVNAIFETLNKAISDKNFDEFIDYLSENIKNLGARIKQIDKKIEKRIKDTLSKTLRDQLTDESI
jgi:hypothetical protein